MSFVYVNGYKCTGCNQKLKKTTKKPSCVFCRMAGRPYEIVPYKIKKVKDVFNSTYDVKKGGE